MSKWLGICRNNCKEQPNPNPDGWDYVGGKYVHVFNFKLNWNEAYAYCQSRGAQLITAEDYETQQWLANQYDKIWIGANDIGYENYWVWADGNPVYNTQWSLGEPNNMFNEDCVAVNERDVGKWNDKYCTERYKFACEKVNYGKWSFAKQNKNALMTPDFYGGNSFNFVLLAWQDNRRVGKIAGWLVCQYVSGFNFLVEDADTRFFILLCWSICSSGRPSDLFIAVVSAFFVGF